MSGKRYPEVTKQTARELRKDGVPFATIAAQFGAAPFTIREWCRDIDPNVNITKPSDVDLAYWAGIIDGEGTVSFTYAKPNPKTSNKSPTVVPRVELCNTYRPLIEKATQFLMKYYAFVQRFGPSAQPRFRANLMNGGNDKSKPLYQISIRGKRAVTLCRDLLPFLVVKAEQAKVLIEFDELAPKAKPTRFTDEEVAERLKYVSRIRILNKKGRATDA